MSEPRVVLTLDCTPSDLAALGGAVRLAERLGARLAVRFVEDEGLINWASLPFTREVGFPTARARAFDCAAMERSLRAAAEAARVRIEQLVHDAARLSFEVRRGALAAELLAALDEADVVIAHFATAGPQAGWIAALSARQQPAAALEALAELAQRADARFEVVIVGRSGPAAGAGEAAPDPRLRLRHLADAGELGALLRAGLPQRPPQPHTGAPRKRDSREGR